MVDEMEDDMFNPDIDIARQYARYHQQTPQKGETTLNAAHKGGENF